MKPRAGDVIGAAVLTLVLFTLVAVIFVAALGERDRAPGHEARSVPVAVWQL